jgi:ribosomal protein S18 acetylase RimI-like enzyme
MSNLEVTLQPVVGDRTRLVPLLLEADESEPVLRVYLNDGELFELMAGGRSVGAVLLTFPDIGTVEIKNIAIRDEHRSQGIGRAAIGCVHAYARRRGADRLLVGTADASLGTIAFYRACGFKEGGRIEGFFDRYPEPVVENGRVAHDMVMFELPVSSSS